jgi:predicted transcriptional regulator
MGTAKQVVRQLLDNLPDDCTLDEIQYHLWVRQRIEEAREEIRTGQFFTQEEIEKDLAQWLGE